MCVGAGHEYLLHFPNTLSGGMMGQRRSKNWDERHAFEGESEKGQEAVCGSYGKGCRRGKDTDYCV